MNKKYVYSVKLNIQATVTFSAPDTATTAELREIAEEHAVRQLSAKSSARLRFGSGRVTAGKQLKGPRSGYRTMRRRRRVTAG